jgi:REP element-mobilizing transposase RayT
VIREMDGVAEAVGGMAGHVHLLIGLKATLQFSDVLRNLKRTSSEWVHVNIPPTIGVREAVGR